MNCKTLSFAVLTLVVGIAGLMTTASAKDKAFTGTVGDALCGVEHSMPVSAVECIRQCIGKGSNYSLIVGDKVYTLQTEDKTILATLEKQAGAKVRIKGTDNGNIINVSSVEPSK